MLRQVAVGGRAIHEQFARARLRSSNCSQRRRRRIVTGRCGERSIAQTTQRAAACFAFGRCEQVRRRAILTRNHARKPQVASSARRKRKRTAHTQTHIERTTASKRTSYEVGCAPRCPTRRDSVAGQLRHRGALLRRQRRRSARSSGTSSSARFARLELRHRRKRSQQRRRWWIPTHRGFQFFFLASRLKCRDGREERSLVRHGRRRLRRRLCARRRTS